MNTLMSVLTNEDYDSFVTDTKIGHVVSYDMPLKTVVNCLSQIRGHIVEMPLRYLEKSELIEGGLNFEVNDVTGNPCNTSATNSIRGNILLSQHRL